MDDDNDLPKRTADTMSDAIAMGSPSGSMSKRSKRFFVERLRRDLFGDGMKRSEPEQPTEIVRLRRQADELMGLAERGMKPRAYKKKANELYAMADELERKMKCIT